jgi:hypothetical protein
MNFQNQQSHGRRRSVFLVQQHNSQRSLLRFVIVARCYGVSTGPRACAHTHPSPVSFVTRCFERARSQPGHVANQIAAGRRCAVLPPSPSAFGRALRGRRGACESELHTSGGSLIPLQPCAKHAEIRCTSAIVSSKVSSSLSADTK